jgi:hypothetical protein
VTRAAWVPEFSLQPGQGVLGEGDGLLPRSCRLRGGGIIARQQLHKRSGQLFGAAAGPLGLEGVPVAVSDRQLLVQLLGQRQGCLGPGGGGHWTKGRGELHPDAIAWSCAMANHSRSGAWRSPRARPQRPALLHQLTALVNLASQPRLPKGDDRPEGAAQRRKRQRQSLAQRLLDPLPPALRPADREAELFWTALRWGGLGLILAWWLGR